MTQNSIVLVKNSWALVAKIEMETVGGLFYNRLFEIMPSVKPMFSRTPIPEQSKKLIVMLSYVIAKLDKLEDIMDEEEHYTAVGTALLWTLEQGLGEQWNADLKLAWAEVYSILADAMIAVQQEQMLA